MSQQIRYYASRKNALTWIAAILALGSITMQILSLCFGGAAQISTVNIWFQKVLPIAAEVLFVVLLLLCGETSFYRLTTPFFFGCVYFGQVALDLHLHGGYALFGYMRYVIVCWILYLLLYLLFRLTVTGRIKQGWIFPLVMLLPLTVVAYDFAVECSTISTFYLFEKISNCLMIAAMLTAGLAMRQFRDGKYHKTWGDRSDGRRLRTIDGMSVVADYIVPNRNGASNSIRVKG